MNWLKEHPEVKTIRVAAADLNGVARGKRIPAEQHVKNLARREDYRRWLDGLFDGEELYLAGVDKSKISGDLAHTAVTTPGFWQIKPGGSGNGTSSKTCEQARCYRRDRRH